MSGERLNPFQHALKRPDVYIGSVQNVTEQVWVVSNDKIVVERCKYNPGIVKLFEEILSNAVDNKWRDGKMTYISVTIDDDSISVKNDGYAIPVKKFKYTYNDPTSGESFTEKRYPAEMFFGCMLAGTNYDDSTERKTSGRNGIGAKAANIFSTKFEIEHVDPVAGKRFVQIYTKNGTTKTEPKISSAKKTAGYTLVTFTPDYKYFKTSGMTNVLQKIIHKMTVDCAMITGLRVSFNGSVVKASNLTQYAAKYTDSVKFAANFGSCVVSQLLDRQFDSFFDGVVKQVSFVNGLNTKDGGVHVDAWKNAIVAALVRKLNASKPKRPVKVTHRDVQRYLMLFVNEEVSNPSFDSQAKTRMNGPKLKRKLEAAEIDKISKWPFVKRMYDELTSSSSENVKVDKKVSKRVFLKSDKVDDANWAGGAKAGQCVLFVTEGLSAKTFAVSGISKLKNGHDRFGAFAIKGKFINAQKASKKAVEKNEEIKILKHVLGLRSGLAYDSDADARTLRYGKVCILTDADDDGIHIRGLLLNYFYNSFPALLERGYVCSMSVPVVKATVKKSVQPFYAMDDYLKWAQNAAKHSIKYYKGLGTFSTAEASTEFSNQKLLEYKVDENAQKSMDLGFKDTQISKRKEWMDAAIESVNENAMIYEGTITLTEFITDQMILYSIMSLHRAIPRMDGLKESQRKVIFGMRKSKHEFTIVERLCGRIADVSNYHHGGKALQDTVVKMAQSFIGSNNVPLVEGDGQFGSRLYGGKDASASRYISARLDSVTDLLFPKCDDELLEHVKENGEEFEPIFYVPILPLVLINGADGIATGYASHVPQYNPVDIAERVKFWIDNKNLDGLEPLVPWTKNFKGTIETDGRSYTSNGIMTKRAGEIVVTELPIGTWTSSFKEKIEQKFTDSKNKLISDIKTYNNGDEVKFVISTKSPDELEKGLEKLMKRKMHMTNMIVLDAVGRPKRYKKVDEIIEDLCVLRLKLYIKRKTAVLRKMDEKIHVMKQKYKFIKHFINGELELAGVEDETVQENMLALGLEKIESSFDYLLEMPMRSLTKTRMDALAAAYRALSRERKQYRKTTVETIWKNEIDAFLKTV